MLLNDQALDDHAPNFMYIFLSDIVTSKSPNLHPTSTTMSNNDLLIDTAPLYVLMYVEYTTEAEIKQTVDDLKNKRPKGVPQRYYLVSEPSFNEMDLMDQAVPTDDVCYAEKNDQARRIALVHLDRRSGRYVAWWIVKIDRGSHTYGAN